MGSRKNKNPLGLHLDFLFGKGYLWAKEEGISDWIILQHLKMEIPDLAFPFDITTGLTRFQHTRCFGREISFDVSEVGLGDLLRQGIKEIDGFDDLQINFLDGAAHITVRVKALGADTFLSFRAALISPEPSRGDEVHLSLYDYRAYGPLPYPARILGFELLSRLLQTKSLRPPGKGSAYKIGIAGDLLNLRPIKILLLHVFVSAGWKLPDLSSISLQEVRISPGRLSIISHSPDINTPQPELREQFGRSQESAKSIAAYEAKDLFMRGDNALFASDVQSAYQHYSELRQSYGNNPELNERILDCLLSMPTLANLAEAESICRDLEKMDADNIRAKLVRATIAGLRDKDAAGAFEKLSASLRESSQVYDFILSELARSQFIARSDPERAARILADLLNVAPRNRGILEELRRLYERIGNTSELEGVLKRLTGVYSDRQSLSETYLELANHLMNRRGEVGEARIFLERVLRLEPTHLEALEILGESYILSKEPLRALKAFSSAARAAENFSNHFDAAQMMFRVSRIWIDEVGDIDQALLAIRRSLELTKLAKKVSGKALLFAANLCKERELFDESIGYYLDAANVFESNKLPESKISAAQAHLSLGKIYYQRERLAPAADHLERSFTIEPSSLIVLDLLAEVHRELGQSDKLLALYKDATQSLPKTEVAAEIHARMADLMAQLGLSKHAEKALYEALAIHPDHRGARLSLFALLAKEERFQELRDVAKRFIAQRNATHAKAEVLLDWALNLGEEERLSVLASAFDYSPANPEIIDAILSNYTPKADGQLRSILERIAKSSGDPFADRAKDFLVQSTQIPTPTRLKAPKRVEDIDARLDDILDRQSLSSLDRDSEKTEPNINTIPELAAKVSGEHDKKIPTLALSEKGKEKLELFRKKLDKNLRTHATLPKPEDLRDGTPLAKILGKKKELKPNVDILSLRKDPQKYVLHLEEELKLEGDEKHRLSIKKELGETYFFELEDNEKARPFLESLRDEDPGGLGADEAILSALESIYEESGDIDARIDILKNRYHRSESEEMKEVYAILIAQIIWEEFEDLERAKEWIRPLLEKDRMHEAANRLAAELHFEAGVFETSVKHFSNVLEVAPDGLDAIEVERKMADIYLNELEEPKKAKAHYQNVLKSAPGDARALDGIKQAQAKVKDWIGYSGSLAHELGLLLGKVRDFDIHSARLIDPEDIVVHVRVPASQIYNDLAKVLEGELFDFATAFQMYGISYALWPDNVESLEGRIKLARNLNEGEALSAGLEQLADMLFDAQAKFDALTEAGRLCLEKDPERSRSLFASAIAIAEADDKKTTGLEEARRFFEGLKK